MIRLEKKLIKLGNSYVVSIPNTMLPKSVKKGDVIVMDLNIIDIIPDLIEYECSSCIHRFVIHKLEPPYCPNCGTTDCDRFKVIDEGFIESKID